MAAKSDGGWARPNGVVRFDLQARWEIPVEDARSLSENARLFLVVGLLGSLTTFSTFGLETVSLWRSGEEALSALSVVANVALGVGGVLLGRALVKLAVSA